MRWSRLVLTLVASVGLLAIPDAASAATPVGGVISSDTTWTLAGSPYQVTSTVQIPSNVTLTIEPGVVVQNAVPADSWESMFWFHGTIEAAGTVANPITFDGGGTADIFDAYGGTADTFLNIDFAIIRNGWSFWTGENGHFTVRHSVFRDLISPSYLWYLENDVSIEYNVFIRSEGFVVAHGHPSQPGPTIAFRWNRFVSRPDDSWSGFSWVENWAAYSGSTIVAFNSFENVGEIAVSIWDEGAAFDATNNYWGTTDTDVIESMIYDSNDAIWLAGTIPYEPFLSEPDPGLPPYPDPVDHERVVVLALSKHLVAKGTVKVPDGLSGCAVGVRIKIQRKVEGAWKTTKLATTHSSGWVTVIGRFKVRLTDKPGRYRAIAVPSELETPTLDVCLKARSSVSKHRHT